MGSSPIRATEFVRVGRPKRDEAVTMNVSHGT